MNLGRTIRNWSGEVRFRPARVISPRSEEELAQEIRRCAAEGLPIRPTGSRHSFTPLVATSGALVSLEAFRNIEVDRARGEATAGAGLTLRELCRALDCHGLALENQGDIDRQTVAGAVSTGTHGTGASLGSLSTQIAGLTLVAGSGEVVECSRERNPRIFEAARVSLGSLGILTRVRLRLCPSYRLEEIRRNEPLDQCLEGLELARRRHRHHEFFWFPHADLAAVKWLDPTHEPERRRPLRDFLSDVVIENAGLWAVSQLVRLLPCQAARIHRLAARLSGEGRSIGASHRMFPTPRLVRFHEMEYAVPAPSGPDCLREIRALVRHGRLPVTFPVEYRHVAADDIPLSPFFGRDSATIAVHVWRPMPYRAYFAAVEAIFRNHRGRPHWGKIHSLTATELRELYPRWDAFQALRAELDPRGVFATPYLDRVLGPVEPRGRGTSAGRAAPPR